MREATKRLVDAATELIGSISFDMNGGLMAGKYMGGNGGLLSSDTLRKSDAVRRAIDAAIAEAGAQE